MVKAGEREYWIDAVRSFACLCVITTHAPMPNHSSGQWVIPIVNYLAMGGASILFFMISGALVLYKEKPILPFLRTRVTRIFLPMVIWTAITLLLDVAGGEIGWRDFAGKMALVPFVPQVGMYWFIYDVFGIYLLTPLLASSLSRCSRRDVEFYLALWAVTLLLPYLQWIDPRFAGLYDVSSGYLYHFYGYLGFALMGYYLRRYVRVSHEWIKGTVTIAVSLAFMFAVYAFTSVPHCIVQGRMAFNVGVITVAYFLMFKHYRLSDTAKNVCYQFAQHSFGIYLVHLIVMRRMIWPLLQGYNIHYALQIPLIVGLTALLSYLLVHLLSRLPGSKYFIGL